MTRALIYFLTTAFTSQTWLNNAESQIHQAHFDGKTIVICERSTPDAAEDRQHHERQVSGLRILEGQPYAERREDHQCRRDADDVPTSADGDHERVGDPQCRSRESGDRWKCVELRGREREAKGLHLDDEWLVKFGI